MGLRFTRVTSFGSRSHGHVNVDGTLFGRALNYVSDKLSSAWQATTNFFGNIFGGRGNSRSYDTDDAPRAVMVNEGSNGAPPRAVVVEEHEQGRAQAQASTVDPGRIFDDYDKNGDGKLKLGELLAMKEGLANDPRFANIDQQTQERFGEAIQSKMRGGVTKAEFLEIAENFKYALNSQPSTPIAAADVPSALPAQDDFSKVV